MGAWFCARPGSNCVVSHRYCAQGCILGTTNADAQSSLHAKQCANTHHHVVKVISVRALALAHDEEDDAKDQGETTHTTDDSTDDGTNVGTATFVLVVSVDRRVAGGVRSLRDVYDAASRFSLGLDPVARQMQLTGRT